MKLIFAMAFGFSLSALATPQFDVSSKEACVLQITKQTAPALVTACGSDTLQNVPIQAYSEMADAKKFQADAKKNFLASIGANETTTCTEHDNAVIYLMICKNP